MSIDGLFVPICTSSIASSVAIVESWTGWDENRDEKKVAWRTISDNTGILGSKLFRA
jgi:hypothetical protein